MGPKRNLKKIHQVRKVNEKGLPGPLKRLKFNTDEVKHKININGLQSVL